MHRKDLYTVFFVLVVSYLCILNKGKQDTVITRKITYDT